MKANAFHLSRPSLAAGVIIHSLVIFGLTALFCRGVGAYTIRKATDALVTFSFCYLLLGLSTWVSRSLRFYNQSERFTNLLRVTHNDRPDLDPARRRLLLLVYENQIFIPWVTMGLVGIILGILFGSVLSAQFPPDSVLDFLVSDTLNPILKPGGVFHP